MSELPVRSSSDSLSYSLKQWSAFRVLFGGFLTLHFSSLVPYATELYSADGMLPDPRVNLTYGYFPNLLVWAEGYVGGGVASGLLILCVALSVMITINRWPRRAALILFYLLHCLYHRNNLTHHLGVNYTGWLLLVVCATPSAPQSGEARPLWRLPRALYLSGWAIFGLSYTISGLDKLHNPDWASGWALHYIAQSPETSAGWPELLLSLPDWAQRGLCWLSLILEICALPLILSRYPRRLIWCGLLGMHLGIMFMMGLFDLTGGILAFYLFLMEPSWFSRCVARVKTALDKTQKPLP